MVFIVSLSAINILAEDVKNSKDHPLISRYPEAEIEFYRQVNYDKYTLPLDGINQEKQLKDTKQISGKLTRIKYEVPAGNSTYEIYQNYKNALSKAGFEILFDGQGDEIGNAYDWANNVYPQTENFNGLIGVQDNHYFISAKLEKNNEVYIALDISKRADDNPLVMQDIIETKELETGKVEVNNDVLDSLDLELEGELDENDEEGSKDHPLISRFPGSKIRYYREVNYDKYTLPLSGLDDEEEITESKNIEGKVTRIKYEVPSVNTTYEVFENYKSALTQAGFKILFEAEGEKLGNSYNWATKVYPETENFSGLIGRTELQRFLSAKLNQPERDIYLTLYVSKTSDDNPLIQQDIITEKKLKADKIDIDVDSLTQTLKTSGFARIYGIYFDTDKATMKKESESTLEVIAEVLKKNKDLDIYVVGHTDSVGDLDYNMDLSMRRAQSIVNELVNNYGINEERLIPKGVGELAPVATNETDKGRAKNRRVELVKR